MKKHLVIFFFNLPFADIAYGQFTYGTTGLLHMPTADMQRDKTVMVEASYLDVAATPGEWITTLVRHWSQPAFQPARKFVRKQIVERSEPDGRI